MSRAESKGDRESGELIGWRTEAHCITDVLDCKKGEYREFENPYVWWHVDETPLSPGKPQSQEWITQRQPLRAASQA